MLARRAFRLALVSPEPESSRWRPLVGNGEGRWQGIAQPRGHERAVRTTTVGDASCKESAIASD